VRRRALGLLARREHSCAELSTKLLARGVSPALVAETVAGLAARGLVSDERYARALCEQRCERGYGPLYVARELSARGVDEGVIAACVAFDDPAWMRGLRRLRDRRTVAASDRAGQARQVRYLRARGYTHEQIQQVMRDPDGE